jgi:hypothetical protein
MGNTIGGSIGWGALFGTIAAFTTASCMSYFWASAKTGHSGDRLTLMVLWVPPVTIMGRRCRDSAIRRGRSDNEFPSRWDRTITSQLCRLGQSSGTRNSDFTVWFLGGGRAASSAPGCAMDVLAVTYWSAPGSNRGSFHQVESGSQR